MNGNSEDQTIRRGSRSLLPLKQEPLSSRSSELTGSSEPTFGPSLGKTGRETKSGSPNVSSTGQSASLSPLQESSWYSLTPRGIDVHNQPSFPEWEHLGGALYHFEKARKWYWADWIILGEALFGEMYSQALEESGYQFQTLANAVSIGRAIPFGMRDPVISFSTHARLAPLARAGRDIKSWLKLARETPLTGKQLGALLKTTVDPKVGAKLVKIGQDVAQDPLAKRPDHTHAPRPVPQEQSGGSENRTKCPNCGYTW